MTTVRRFLACALAFCLMLPLLAIAYADSTTPLLEGAFKQGAYASEGSGTVYFVVDRAGQSGLYSVPSQGGSISLLETQSSISNLVAVDEKVYYLRSVSGALQLVCRTADSLNVMHVYADGSTVSNLGYYDGKLYAISNGWLYSYDALTGSETLISEEEMTDYTILGGRVYYVSAINQRIYTRTITDGSTLSVTAGCLYSMALDGTDVLLELENGLSDLRGYGEYLYYHNYQDNYPVANSSNEKWLDGRLYRYNIVVKGTPEKANDGYDWDYYPTGNGLLLYTANSLDIRNVTAGTDINLMKPEDYTSVTVDGEFALVYQHTSQSITRVPTNAETPVKLGETLPLGMDAAAQVTENDLGNAASAIPASAYIFPQSNTRKLTTTDLKQVDPTLWALGRNEILARHGYEFTESTYANYFSQRTWYKAGGYASTDLSSIEQENMAFIQKYEEQFKDEIAAIKAGATRAPSNTTTPTTTKAPTVNANATDSSYIFPDSNKRLLTREDILSIDRSLWGYARNEIWARHGYVFKKDAYAKYFANKTWYRPGGFSNRDLNSIEWANMELIKEMESEY